VSIATSTAVSPSTGTTANRSISTGAIIGVAFGAFAAIAILVGLIFFFWYKSRRNTIPPVTVNAYREGKPELEGRLTNQRVMPYEMPVEVSFRFERILGLKES
jgi:hypothetical protein